LFMVYLRCTDGEAVSSPRDLSRSLLESNWADGANGCELTASPYIVF